jgi:hypothetical protein
MSDRTPASIQEEVDRNYEAFRTMLPTIIGSHRDKYALMKDGKILGYYSSAEDARVAATTFINDGLFSVQQVTDLAINLGYYSNAVPVHSIQS